jgi:hypothetical protein
MQNTNLLQKFSGFTLALTILAALIGCGGGGSGGGSEGSSGGSGGGSEGSSGVSTSEGSTNVADDGSENRGLDDLEVNRDNSLSAISELNIEVAMSARRSYLSICPGSVGAIDVNTLDYNSCMIRAAINASNNAFKLSIPNHLDSLVAILWFYDTKKEPFVSHWQRQGIKGTAIDSSWRISVPD